MRTPFVSVVIPVRESDRLYRCLAALEEQTYPAHCFEVIVVDNRATPPLAERVRRRFPDVKVLEEPKPGSYRARNAGWKASRGEVVAFTDADCVPRPEWIDASVYAVQRGAHVVAGHVAVTVPGGGRLHPVVAYEMVNGFPQSRYVHRSGWCATANMVTTRSILETVGPFAEDLVSGGDAEWGKRATRMGYPPTYVEAAVVAHPARSSFREYYKKLVRVRVGQYQQDRLDGLPSPHQRLTLVDLRPPMGAWRRAHNSEVLLTTAARLAYVGGEIFVRYAGSLALAAAARRDSGEAASI